MFRFLIIGLGVLTPIAASAQTADGFISVGGVKSLRPPEGVIYTPPEPEPEPGTIAAPPDVVIGAPMPPQYMMLFNPARHGLPRPRDGWVYFEAGGAIYRVNLVSRTVLEQVVPQDVPQD